MKHYPIPDGARRAPALISERSPAGRQVRGFTIIELMITVSVIAILGTSVVPALGTFVKNSRLKASAYEVMSAITLARSEAVKRGSRAILCRTADPHAGEPSCGGSTQDWSTGWLVFIDEDGNDVFDAGTDILLTVGEQVDAGVELRSNEAADDALIFRPDGSTAGGATARFGVCDDRGPAHGRQVNIARVGRPGLVTGTVESPLDACTPG